MGSDSPQTHPLVSANPGLVRQVVALAHTASGDSNWRPGGDPFLDRAVPPSFFTEQHEGFPYDPQALRRGIRGQARAILSAFDFLVSRQYTQDRWMGLVAKTGLDERILEAIRNLEGRMEEMLFGQASDKIDMDTYRQRVECVKMRDLLLRLLMSRIARRTERIMEGLAEGRVIGGDFGSIPPSPARVYSDVQAEDETPVLEMAGNRSPEEPGVRATVSPTNAPREIDGGSPQAAAALEGNQDGEYVPDQAEFAPALPWGSEQRDWSASWIDAVLSGQATEAPTAPYLANVVTWTAQGDEVIKQMWRESFGIQPMPPDQPGYMAYYFGQPYCFMCCKMATQEHLASGAHSQRVRWYEKQYPTGYITEYYRRCIELQTRARTTGGPSPGSHAVSGTIYIQYPHTPTQQNKDECPSHSELQSGTNSMGEVL